MQYREVSKRDRQEIELLLRRKDSTEPMDALLSAAYYDPDWQWVQSQCLSFPSHEDRNVRALSATVLSPISVNASLQGCSRTSSCTTLKANRKPF
jgi:hypothetical protein